MYISTTAQLKLNEALLVKHKPESVCGQTCSYRQKTKHYLFAVAQCILVVVGFVTFGRDRSCDTSFRNISLFLQPTTLLHATI